VLLLSFRDLQWRRRRFLVSVAATALVFSLTLLLSGAASGLRNEAARIVDVVGAEAWVVPEGTSGPFTTSTFLLPDDVEAVTAGAGGGRADPLVFVHSTVGDDDRRDVNVIGHVDGGLGAPPVGAGRAAAAPGEAVADTRLDAGVGDRIVLAGRPFTVVGEASGVTFYFGTPTVFVGIDDARAIAFDGQPLTTAVLTEAAPGALPDGVVALDRDAVAEDLRRPQASGLQTIQFINLLLWLIAAGIIGSIVYLSALERSRDFAVLKATGASNRALLGGLVVQAVVLALVAALVGTLLARLLEPGFPFSVETSVGAYVALPVVAVVVGLLASLGGLRRAVAVDPALAFRGG
jgi:putative ABC transport system permease protein